jgi:hypothetical protein
MPSGDRHNKCLSSHFIIIFKYIKYFKPNIYLLNDNSIMEIIFLKTIGG